MALKGRFYPSGLFFAPYIRGEPDVSSRPKPIELRLAAAHHDPDLPRRPPDAAHGQAATADGLATRAQALAAPGAIELAAWAFKTWPRQTFRRSRPGHVGRSRPGRAGRSGRSRPGRAPCLPWRRPASLHAQTAAASQRAPRLGGQEQLVRTEKSNEHKGASKHIQKGRNVFLGAKYMYKD